MASLRQIKQRMKSIHNIHEITKAMGMIASFRFKRSENRFSKSRDYFLEMENLVANLSVATVNLSDLRRQEFGGQALFEKRKIKKKALVVMTGDKGLCGAYNANLLKEAVQWRRQNSAFETVLIPIGKVGNDFFKKKQQPILTAYPEKAIADLPLAKKVTEALKNFFLSGQVDSIELLYTTYRTGFSGKNTVIPYLGLSYLLEGSASAKKSVDYIYEPDFNTVFVSLLSGYLEGKIYMTLLESLTSESSARMFAMKQATDNAEDVLDNLKLLRNKTRQATITRELSEIVSGASVLI